MRTAVAMIHVPFEGLGSLAGVLSGQGFSIQILDACTADLQAFDPLAPELLVVLGGPIGVYEVGSYPFLAHEIQLVQRRLQARLPTIGVCLGSQLMATALGSAVYPGKNGKEIGWSPVDAGRDSAACPAMEELLAPGLQLLHWHGDTFDLPAGAAHLASTSRYVNQAYSVGTHALGLQFHPEVDAMSLERWYVGHACELAAAKIDVARLRDETARFAPSLQSAAQRFWRRWLESAFAG